MLGFVAAYVDTIGFVVLYGLFTAHVTGNFVLLGVAVATGAGGDFAKAMTVPVFVAVAMLACVLVRLLERAGRRPLVPMLVLEWLLLGAFLLTGWQFLPRYGPDDPETLAVIAFAVAAMAVQNAVMRRVLGGLPSTTVMTSNLTQVSVDVVDALWGGDAGRAARARLGRTVPVVLTFGAGAAAAGLGYRAYGFRALAAALAILAAATALAGLVEE